MCRAFQLFVVEGQMFCGHPYGPLEALRHGGLDMDETHRQATMWDKSDSEWLHLHDSNSQHRRAAKAQRAGPDGERKPRKKREAR